VYERALLHTAVRLPYQFLEQAFVVLLMMFVSSQTFYLTSHAVKALAVKAQTTSLAAIKAQNTISRIHTSGMLTKHREHNTHTPAAARQPGSALLPT
jgi:hypothetical protein